VGVIKKISESAFSGGSRSSWSAKRNCTRTYYRRHEVKDSKKLKKKGEIPKRGPPERLSSRSSVKKNLYSAGND